VSLQKKTCTDCIASVNKEVVSVNIDNYLCGGCYKAYTHTLYRQVPTSNNNPHNLVTRSKNGDNKRHTTNRGIQSGRAASAVLGLPTAEDQAAPTVPLDRAARQPTNGQYRASEVQQIILSAADASRR
jgi:hypothetical protein